LEILQIWGAELCNGVVIIFVVFGFFMLCAVVSDVDGHVVDRESACMKASAACMALKCCAIDEMRLLSMQGQSRKMEVGMHVNHACCWGRSSI